MRTCRICLNPDITNQFSNCFDNGGMYAKMLYDLFKIVIVEMADNPAIICRKCEKHVIQAFDLRKLVLRSEENERSPPMKNEHYIFHANLRELKSLQGIQETSVEVPKPESTNDFTEKLSVPTIEPKISQNPEVETPQQQQQVNGESSKSSVNAVEEPPKDKQQLISAKTQEEISIEESLRILNRYELEDFMKDAESMLIEALDDAESVASMESSHNKTTVPVTKCSFSKSPSKIKKRRKKRFTLTSKKTRSVKNNPQKSVVSGIAKKELVVLSSVNQAKTVDTKKSIQVVNKKALPEASTSQEGNNQSSKAVEKELNQSSKGVEKETNQSSKPVENGLIAKIQVVPPKYTYSSKPTATVVQDNLLKTGPSTSATLPSTTTTPKLANALKSKPIVKPLFPTLSPSTSGTRSQVKTPSAPTPSEPPRSGSLLKAVLLATPSTDSLSSMSSIASNPAPASSPTPPSVKVKKIISPKKTKPSLETIEIVSSDDESQKRKKSSKPDVFGDLTVEQLMEMTEMIEQVLPPEPKRRKKKNNHSYINKIKIDVKSSTIIEASTTSAPAPIMKRRESIYKLPHFRVVGKKK